MIEHLKVPSERIGVIIGPKGKIKEVIEEKSTAKLVIDSENGIVEILEPKDPIKGIRAKEVVLAIARGFSPEKALKLFEDEYLALEVIDLSIMVRNDKDLQRIKGRIIGKDGKTREIFESLLGVKVSVYGKTVSLLGYPDQNAAARAGIEMLIGGSSHGPVYNFLERKRQELKRAEMEYY
jgi:ribosomal RNA assembly protein